MLRPDTVPLPEEIPEEVPENVPNPEHRYICTECGWTSDDRGQLCAPILQSSLL